jgi:hypothetical protein
MIILPQRATTEVGQSIARTILIRFQLFWLMALAASQLFVSPSFAESLTITPPNLKSSVSQQEHEKGAISPSGKKRLL